MRGWINWNWFLKQHISQHNEILKLRARCFASSSDKSEIDEILNTIDSSRIRNFSIIAHVDHGKSTLSDRMLQLTGTVKANERAQYLDKLQVERERGITVKAQTASLIYKDEGITYVLNLIDTPGHVDFSYEVSRSLAACEGVLLLVDAAQGIQAQTLANFLLAKRSGLCIIPVINKIDLTNADPARVTSQVAGTRQMVRNPIKIFGGSPRHPPIEQETVQSVLPNTICTVHNQTL